MPVEILLIEDNGADVRIIKEIVSYSSAAVRLTVAEEGGTALALLDNPLFNPHLIITDISLPKISGLELLRRFSGNGIPVVVFSASKNLSDKAEALALGAREFVEKPLDLDEYTEAVWKMIGKWAKPPD
jgi:CheY-like chemotaxis protein